LKRLCCVLNVSVSGYYKWRQRQAAAAQGAPVSACPAGTQRSGALCYPRCQAGFYGIATTCWQVCPAGYKDDGAICRKDVISVAKASYGRGAGQAMNSVPEAVDEIVRTPKDTPVNLVFEYNDLNDEIDSVIHVQLPRYGNLDGNTYTPNPGYEGPDTILWKLTDGKNESNVAIATILVGNVGVNSAPVAVDRTVEVIEDTPITITVTCTDAENDDLFYQLVAKPQHGSYQWVPPNQVIYTPDPDFTGTDFFTFRSHDGQDASNVSTITLNVGPVNDAPLAQGQAISTTRNSNVGITLAATDAEGDAISYTVVTSPTHGLLSGTAPNLLYAPAPEFVGQDSLVFRASDGQEAFTEATIDVTVHAVNSAPLAQALALTTTEDGPVTVDLGASDAEGDAITFTLVTSPTHGLLEGEGAEWIYTPEAGFVGTDGFTYQASDGQSATMATVSIQVAAGLAQANVVGIVYDDVNGNGQPDEGEIGADGLLVTLVPTSAQKAGAATNLAGGHEMRTDATGAWRFEAVPLGAYTLRITGASGVAIATPVEVALNVDQRGTVQAPLAAVVVTGRALFLPRVMAQP
jgi:large repetitive protein